MSVEPISFGERFELRKRLGEGSFGVVFEAWDRERDSRVALKALKTADAYALYNLKREFRTLADVSHPNLVDFYELLSNGDHWFITMELVDGRNFFYYVRQREQTGAFTPTGTRSTDETIEYTQTRVRQPRQDDLTLSEAQDEEGPEELPTRPEIHLGKGDLAGLLKLGITTADTPSPTRSTALSRDGLERLTVASLSLAEGLMALHSAGIVHRDVKPSNVLVGPDGQVKLLDFGLVRSHDQALVSQHIAGTPAYMAPEQAAGRPVSEASDWFSVGVMLWEALVGYRPERGPDSSRPVPPPGEIVDGVPEHLDRLCHQLVAAHPGERPRGEAVLRKLGRERAELASAPVIRDPVKTGRRFVGRSRELGLLAAALEHSERRNATVAAVHGSSGMGKTALVLHFLAGLERERSDVVALRGRCYERESVPYKAVDSLVDALAVYLTGLPHERVEGLLPRDVLALARLFPVLRRVPAIADARRRFVEISDSRELRRRAFAALRDLLSRLSERQVTLLFIDDLQWGDEDSALLLRDVLRPPDAPPVLLIVTYRSEEIETSPSLATFLDAKSLRQGDRFFEIPVGELDPAESLELARTLAEGGHLEAAQAESLVSEAAGSPFFLEKLIELGPAREAQGTERDDKGVATGLDGVLLSMVGSLPAELQRLLEVLAVVGRPANLRLATDAAGITGDVQALLRRLETARLVRRRDTERGEELEIYHDRIRQAVLDSLSPQALSSHHRRLFATMSAAGGIDAEALAMHAEGAGERETASHYYSIAAGEAARALAFGTAADLYARALALRDAQDEEHRRMRIEMGRALANAGRGAEAARAFLSAATETSSDSLELRRLAAQHLLMSGHLDEGLETIESVLTAHGMALPPSPRRALVSILLRRIQLRLRGLGFRERSTNAISDSLLERVDTCWTVSSGLFLSNTIYALAFHNRGLLLALAAGEPLRIARSLSLELAQTASRGSRARRRTRETARAAAAAAKRANEPLATAMATLYSGCAAALNGEWRRTVELSDRAEEIFQERCTGVAWEIDNAHLFSLFGLSWLGEYRDLVRRLPPLARDAEERRDLFMLTYLGTDIEPRVLLAADRPDEAAEAARRAIARWPFPGYHRQHQYALRALVEIDLYRGDGWSAWKRIEAEYDELGRSLLLRTQMNRIIVSDYRARSALAATTSASGRSERARLLRQARREIRRLHGEKAGWSEPLALALESSLASTGGRRERARELLAAAEAGFDACEMRLHAAAARWRRARLLGGPSADSMAMEAESWMRDQGIARPDRWLAMLLPWPADPLEAEELDDR